MSSEKTTNILVERYIITSVYLEREVTVDFYFPPNSVQTSNLSLLLINDGQDLVTMNFEDILDELYEDKQINDLFCVALKIANVIILLCQKYFHVLS